jgi:large subunit ribosomal protein L21
MYAVIQTGGKQYRVSEGQKICIEKVAGNPGDSVTFDYVLLVGGEKLTIGQPTVAGAKVEAKIVAQDRAKKITVASKDIVNPLPKFRLVASQPEKARTTKWLIKRAAALHATVVIPTRNDVELKFMVVKTCAPEIFWFAKLVPPSTPEIMSAWAEILPSFP